MNFDDFIKKFGKLPVFESEILLSGVQDSRPVKVQICRWVKTGKLVQLRRGIYALSKAYRKIEIYEPAIAAVLKKPSYISLEKALEYHGLIPEAVARYTCVTTKRPGKFETEAGTFVYRHIKNSLFWGYSSLTVNQQTAFMANPEKALLDYFYLNGGTGITRGYLQEMRFQNFEKIIPERLAGYAQKFQSPGMTRVAGLLARYREEYLQGVKQL